jgi:hypothetical protein
MDIYLAPVEKPGPIQALFSVADMASGYKDFRFKTMIFDED